MENVVKAPPSKSISHRALICGGLSHGESIIDNLLISDDTKRTMDCLSRLGAKIDFVSYNSVKIKGIFRESAHEKTIDLNVGESGTTCRLIISIVAALRGMDVRIHGTGRMHDRPVDDLTDALITLGVEIIFEEKKGYPPLIIKAKGIEGGQVSINIEKSSQYLSGLLLAAPLCSSSLDIHVTGKKIVSWPYVGLTISTMDAFGVPVSIYIKEEEKWILKKFYEIEKVEPGKIKFKVSKTKYMPTKYVVEGDFSNASYLIAAGVLLREGLKIQGLNKNSLQGDKKIIDILKQMGADIYWDKDVLICKKSNLHGISVNMKDCPDLVPTVGVMATMAEGKTVITGVEHLRIKESDRLAGVADQIKKVGAKVTLFEDGLEIEPAPLPVHKEIEFLTYNDHRMAMSMSLYELVDIYVKLDNRQCVSKSFPEFFDVFTKIKKLK